MQRLVRQRLRPDSAVDAFPHERHLERGVAMGVGGVRTVNARMRFVRIAKLFRFGRQLTCAACVLALGLHTTLGSTSHPADEIKAVQMSLDRAYRTNGKSGLLAATQDLLSAKSEVLQEALGRLLLDEDTGLVIAGLHALGQFPKVTDATIAQIAMCVTRPEIAVGLNASGPGDIPLWLAEAVVRAGGSADTAYRALSYLRVEDGRLVPLLLKGTSSRSLKTRWHSVTLLGDLGPRAATAYGRLADIARQPGTAQPDEGGFSPEEIRAKAAFALGCIGVKPEETIPLLVSLLTDASHEMRTNAALGIGRFGERGQSAIPALIDALGDSELGLKSLQCAHSAHPSHPAASALVNIGRRSIPHLVAALGHPSWRVRLNATEALSWFGPTAALAIPALKTLLRDQEPVVRAQAVFTLSNVTTSALDLLNALAPMAKDPDPRVHHAVFCVVTAPVLERLPGPCSNAILSPLGSIVEGLRLLWGWIWPVGQTRDL